MNTHNLGIFILFALQFSVLVYCSIQFFREARKSRYGIQKKLARSKQLAYALIIFCLLFNLFRLFNNLFNLVDNSPNALVVIDAICESLPTLLLFTLTTELSFFYYQLCISLEEDTETIRIKTARMEKQFIGLNIAIYASAGALAGIYVKTDSPVAILALMIVLIGAFLLGVSLFIIETIRLFGVANRMRDLYQLRVGPKIGFFAVALGFFLCKLGAQGYLIYRSLQESGGLNDLFLENYKEYTGQGLAGVFYLSGEFGSLLSLIILIKRHTHSQSSGKSFTEGSTVVEDLEENMIETTTRGDDQYIDTSVRFL